MGSPFLSPIETALRKSPDELLPEERAIIVNNYSNLTPEHKVKFNSLVTPKLMEPETTSPEVPETSAPETVTPETSAPSEPTPETTPEVPSEVSNLMSSDTPENNVGDSTEAPEAPSEPESTGNEMPSAPSEPTEPEEPASEEVTA